MRLILLAHHTHTTSNLLIHLSKIILSSSLVFIKFLISALSLFMFESKLFMFKLDVQLFSLKSRTVNLHFTFKYFRSQYAYMKAQDHESKQNRSSSKCDTFMAPKQLNIMEEIVLIMHEKGSKIQVKYPSILACGILAQTVIIKVLFQSNLSRQLFYGSYLQQWQLLEVRVSFQQFFMVICSGKSWGGSYVRSYTLWEVIFHKWSKWSGGYNRPLLVTTYRFRSVTPYGFLRSFRSYFWFLCCTYIQLSLYFIYVF